MQLVEPHQRELLHGAREVLCYLAVISLHRSTGEPASCVNCQKYDVTLQLFCLIRTASPNSFNAMHTAPIFIRQSARCFSISS